MIGDKAGRLRDITFLEGAEVSVDLAPCLPTDKLVDAAALLLAAFADDRGRDGKGQMRTAESAEARRCGG